MAVRIRLRRMGAKRQPFYRLVAADSRSAGNGKYIESFGYYNPSTEPVQLRVDEEKALEWLQKGALPSETARSLLRKTGVLQKWEGRKGEAPASGAGAEPEGVPADAEA